jgi:hypothetical protein
VFLFDSFVVEAVPSDGVRLRSLYDEVLESVLRVRRSSLSDSQRITVALRAATTLGTSYGILDAIRFGWKMKDGLWNLSFYSYGKGVICSKIFFDAHLEVARLPLQGCPLSGMIAPAHLSHTADLVDVQVPWVKI